MTREHLEKVKGFINLGIEKGAELIVNGCDWETLKYKVGILGVNVSYSGSRCLSYPWRLETLHISGTFIYQSLSPLY